MKCGFETVEKALKIVAIVAAVFLVVMVLRVFMEHPFANLPENLDIPARKSTMTILDGTLIVSNNEAFDLRNCTVSQLAKKQYFMFHVTLRAGEEIFLDPTQFADLDDKMFVNDSKVRAATIQCDSDQGKREFAVTFQ